MRLFYLLNTHLLLIYTLFYTISIPKHLRVKLVKTNQTMQVTIGDYKQPIEHKTMMGNLNALWDYGNGLRVLKGLPPINQTDWLRSPLTRELLLALQRRHSSQDVMWEMPILEKDEKGRTKLTDITKNNPFIKTKRGTGGGTWVHLYLMLDAAAWLDADFKLHMYDTFINNNILQWRDDGGDEFINLNIAIDAYLPERDGMDNVNVFIYVAKQLKAKILSPYDTWNTASLPQLEKRARLEKDLCNYLRLGMIRNYDHLKEVIAKI